MCKHDCLNKFLDVFVCSPTIIRCAENPQRAQQIGDPKHSARHQNETMLLIYNAPKSDYYHRYGNLVTDIASFEVTVSPKLLNSIDEIVFCQPIVTAEHFWRHISMYQECQLHYFCQAKYAMSQHKTCYTQVFAIDSKHMTILRATYKILSDAQ